MGRQRRSGSVRDDELQSTRAAQGVPGHSLTAGVGVDRKAGDYRIAANALWSLSGVDGANPCGAAFVGDEEIERTDVSLVVAADRSFARETRTLRVFAVYDPAEATTFSRVIGAVSVRDNVWIEGSAGLLTGSSLDVIGRLTAARFRLRSREGLLLNPVPIFAFNPGPITGDGNWTWLFPGRVPTLIDAGTGEARISTRSSRRSEEPDSTRCWSHMATSITPSGARGTRGRFGVTRFPKMPWRDRDAKWPVDWSPLADGDVIAAGDAHWWRSTRRGTHRTTSASGTNRSRTVFCGDLAIKGNVGLDSRAPGRRPGGVSRLARSDPRSGAARLLPAHGPVIDDPGRVLRGYIDHRSSGRSR